MRQRRFEASSRMLDWKVWTVAAVSILALFLVVYCIILYKDLLNSKTEGFSDTKHKVLNETEIVDIKKVERFNGDQSYHVVFGRTKDDKDKIVFVPLQSKKTKLTIIDQKKTMSTKEVEAEWRSHCDSCKWIKITPAMVDDEPLWEVIYKDKENRYVYDYLSIYNGERYEQFRLASMYK